MVSIPYKRRLSRAGRILAIWVAATFILFSFTVPRTSAASSACDQLRGKTSDAFTESIPGTLVKFDMVGIPAGEIVVPDTERESATRCVRIKPFWIGKTEVTWDEYDVFAFGLDEPATAETGGKDAISRPSKPYGAVDRGFGRKGYPVINVSYHGAQQYCKWLSVKTGRKYRLPTEAEW